MAAYRRRIIDGLLDDYLPHLPAIALEGAKGVGKTATASERAASVIRLDDPYQRETLEADVNLVTTLEPTVMIDEWQIVPAVWDRVRRSVDDGAAGGRYLLTGSAAVPPGTRIHSGAGRIVSLKMRPLTFAERGVTDAVISFAHILDGTAEITGQSTFRLPDYTEEILRSGLPGLRDYSMRARNVQLDSYVNQMIERELPENGVEVRRPGALRSWLAAYAAATSTDASYSAILDAATAGESDKPSRQTVQVYREHLSRLYILDQVPAWTPAFTPLTRLTKAPKHHLVDPALAARLVGVDAAGLLAGEGRRSSVAGTWLGALFESLVTQSVRVYAETADARVGHLRTRNTEREVDLIVEGPGMRVVAIEVKLSGSVDDKDVRHLNWLRSQIGDRLVDRIVINTGPFAYRRPDGVAVIPLALLGP